MNLFDSLKRHLRMFSLRGFYEKYYKKKFFSKIFFAYFLVTTVASLVLFAVLSENLKTIKQKESLDISSQVLSTVDDFIDNKINHAESIQQKLIFDRENWAWLTMQLNLPGPETDDPVKTEDEYRQINQTISRTAYSIDSQINGLYLYGMQSKRTMIFGNYQNNTDYRYLFHQLNAEDYGDGGGQKLLSGRQENDHTNSFSVFLSGSIQNPDNFSVKIGEIAMSFDSMNIRQSYRRFDDFIKGKLYILDGNGTLLFDSSASYQMDRGFPFGKIANLSSAKTESGEILYNSIYNPRGEYYIVNLIPEYSIAADVRTLQKSILQILLIVALVSILLTFLSTRYFSARLRVIKDTIETVSQGNLTHFKPQKKYDDEVGYIYSEFLSMCSALHEHIEIEYIYKLKQKEMELYTLQTQINPHFLYNSLESIRMNLYLKGETEASRMICILSEMFRNMTRKGSVVTIRDELNCVRSYLELNQFRFGKRLDYHIEVSEGINQYATMKYILQPIVENALVHGVIEKGTMEDPGKIRITARKEGTDIVFTVQDNGSGIKKEELAEIRRKLDQEDVFYNSVGLYNVNGRLKMIYGPDHKLVIDSREHSGTEVTVRIKAMRKEELESFVRSFDCR